MDIKNVSFSKATIDSISRKNQQPIPKVVNTDTDKPRSIDEQILEMRKDELNKAFTPTVGRKPGKKPFEF